MKSDLVRCECCGIMAKRSPYPVGWSQTGRSRWGDKHEPDGIAWWCPDCTAAQCDTGKPKCGKKTGAKINVPTPRRGTRGGKVQRKAAK